MRAQAKMTSITIILTSISFVVSMISPINNWGAPPAAAADPGDGFSTIRRETPMNQKRFLLSSISLAVLVVIGQARALGQTGAPESGQGVAQEIQQVVVTGTALARGTRKIDTAFSITTA